MLLLNPLPAISNYRLLTPICVRSTHKFCQGASNSTQYPVPVKTACSHDEADTLFTKGDPAMVVCAPHPSTIRSATVGLPR